MDGASNGTGSMVGYNFSANGTFGDTTVFYDGRQSMPLFYNNNQAGSLKYSETGRTFTPAIDLTVNGMNTLTFYVQGKRYNGIVPLYVGLQSGANRYNVTYGDQMIVRSTSWVEVNIPLADFTGVNAGAVDAIYIGLGNPAAPTKGGSGQVFIDAIRATKAAETPQAPEVTVEYQVSASKDDVYAANDNIQNSSNDYLRAGLSSFAGPPYYMSGMVFRNVDIPQSAEIFIAKLKVRSHNSRLTANVYSVINAEATDNVDAFSSSRHIGSLLTTSTSVDWTIEESWSADTWYESPDIANVIQEVIDRPGWMEGNSLAIICSAQQDEGGYRNISSFDRGSDYAPVLEITYKSQ
ncbi:hypothetical protein ACFL3Q_04470 [Planctomycetota bacterium]